MKIIYISPEIDEKKDDYTGKHLYFIDYVIKVNGRLEVKTDFYNEGELEEARERLENLKSFVGKETLPCLNY